MQKLFLVCFFFIFSLSYGQKSGKYTNLYKTFLIAEELFEKGQYSASEREFEKFILSTNNTKDPLYIKARYYQAIAALELFNNNATELLKKFNEDFPDNIYKQKIYLKLGNYYFQKRKYEKSLNYFYKLNKRKISKKDLIEFYFKLGYANFQVQNYKKSRDAFYEIIDKKSNYQNPALYYYSHIAYQNKNYQEALEGFKKLEKEEKFTKVVSYYIIQILYLQKKYDELIKYSPNILDTKKTKQSADISYLIGDAYYKIKKYDEAVPYLEKYNSKKQTTREEDYQLGHAYLESGQYSNAVRIFNRVSTQNDLLSQIALYNMAKSYMLDQKLNYARTAFESASLKNFDTKIQEDALFNFAILSYKLDYSPYDEAIKSLKLYLEKYPNSKRKKDVYQYLVNVYTTTKNYQLALESLKEIKNTNPRLKQTYQFLAYNRAIELFQNNDYNQSIIFFNLVEQNNIDPILTAKSTYWKGDAYYNLKNYDEAIKQYRKFFTKETNYLLNEHHTCHYNIAYAYLQKHDTLSALQSFRTYLQQANIKDTTRKIDAFLRSGDCYFTMKKNEDAIKYYQEVININKTYQDYALYQQAITYGYNGEFQKKINTLQNIVNNYSTSPLVVKSIFEIGMTYQNLARNKEALKYYNQIITDYPKKTNVIEKSLYNMGVIYLQERNYNKAEFLFKRVLEEYATQGEQCKDVIHSLIDLYKAQNTPEKVSELPKLYPCAEISDNEQEFIFFETAFGLYQDSNYSQAITSINNYLNKYPNGPHKIDLLFFLAESHYNLKDTLNAIISYENLIEEKNNSLTEKALIRASFLRFKRKEYQESLEHFSKLKDITTNPNQLFKSYQGLMRCYLYLKNWRFLENYAIKTLENKEVLSSDKPEAKFCLALAQMNLEKPEQAISNFNYVTKNSQSLIKIQSKFYISQIYYKQKKYNQSEKEIRQLAKYKPSNSYWLAKAFILMTKNLIQQNEFAQAEFTLNSIIKNYKNKEDGIIDESNELMNEIKQLKEPKKNSINEGGNIIEIDNSQDITNEEN